MNKTSKFVEKIKEHLAQEYCGIFTEQQILQHLNDYVGNSQSDFLIERIQLTVDKKAKILDVGSGYGSFTLAAIKQGYDCYGIEIAEFEHQISKERCVENSVDPSVFTLGSALDMPYANETFDVVTFWNVLEHINDYKAAIIEAFRVLKPNGKIFIIAPNYCSFRREAHYHVPWLPMLPKPIARIYLKMIKRNSRFLDESIFYITIFGLKRFIRSMPLTITNDLVQKIDMNYKFKSRKVNILIDIINKLRMLKLFTKLAFFIKTHPFTNAIDVVLRK